MAHLDTVRLVVCVVALAFFIHDEDALLPLVVGLGDVRPDVGDDGGIACRDPSSDGGNHHSLCVSFVSPSGQLCFSLQLLEVDHRRVCSHLQLPHSSLVHFFDGGVAELCLERSYEILPVRISVSGSVRISVVVDSICLSVMGPPVMCLLGEVGGHKDDHQG